MEEDFKAYTKKDIIMFHYLDDLQLSLSALLFLEEMVDFEKKYSPVEIKRARCMHDQCIVSYGRPFKANHNRELNFQEIGIEPTPENINLHKELITQRDKVVAHSDLDKIEIDATGFYPYNGCSIVFPMIVHGDGLHFIKRIDELQEWIRSVYRSLAQTVFSRVNELGPNFNMSHNWQA